MSDELVEHIIRLAVNAWAKQYLEQDGVVREQQLLLLV
jgi:hypothetical protein